MDEEVLQILERVCYEDNWFQKEKLLTNKKQEIIGMQKSVIFVKKGLKINMLKIKNIVKLETLAII